MNSSDHFAVSPAPENGAVAQPPRALPGMTALLPAALASLRRRPRSGTGRPLRASFRLAGMAPTAVAAYRGLIGDTSGGLPLTYFYLLAQRAQLAMMVADAYPYAVPGMVHVGNTLRLHEAPRLDRPYSIGVVADFHADEQQREWVRFELAFEQNGRLIASCLSDYLARRPPPRRGAAASERTERPELPARDGSEQLWSFDAHAGWRYARVSGDYNPIHLSGWMARLFGFRRPIVQGMYALARAAAAIEQDVQRPLAAVAVRFRRPLALPGSALLRWDRHGGQGCFALQSQDGETLHLHGSYETA